MYDNQLPQLARHYGQSDHGGLEVTIKPDWREPKLDDLPDDAILDVRLAHNGVSKGELRRLVDEARMTLERVPRRWADERQVR
jgi:hypothetical protein